MWDYVNLYEQTVNAIVERMAYHSIEPSSDRVSGIYTIVDAAGGKIHGPGSIALPADLFMVTCDLTLSVMCWIAWFPPKPEDLVQFISERRNSLFENAANDPKVRLEIASRVNRMNFSLYRKVTAISCDASSQFHPFDFFNFSGLK